jgi:hypothetical protein
MVDEGDERVEDGDELVSLGRIFRQAVRKLVNAEADAAYAKVKGETKVEKQTNKQTDRQTERNRSMN